MVNDEDYDPTGINLDDGTRNRIVEVVGEELSSVSLLPSGVGFHGRTF